MNIKYIIFDFDGTLLDLVDAHKEALNKAIESVAGKQFIISDDDHNLIYNGLSTRKKLSMLVEKNNLNENLIELIHNEKQKYTLEYIENNITIDLKMINTLSFLKNEGYKLFVASNAMYQTVKLGLEKAGIFNWFDYVMGNDEIINQKPNPEIYLKTFLLASASPQECLIVEDSAPGRLAAIKSGAHVLTVDNPIDTTYERIKNKINSIKQSNIKWVDNKLNIVLPMAGAGSRFTILGFELPKPLINVLGAPMIQRVVENINVDANYIFIVQKAHVKQYNLNYLLPLIAPNCKIVELDGLTEGAACSVLKAKSLIDNDNKLFIINSDQYIDMDFSKFFSEMHSKNTHSSIICFEKHNDFKWSYVSVNKDGFIDLVKEKEPISSTATVGAYYFRSGKDFVYAAEEMIKNNDRTNGELYLAPSFNYLKEKKTIPYIIPTESFSSLGTPEDLEEFLKNKKSF